MCLMSSEFLQLVLTPQLAKLFCKTGCSARQIFVKERNSCLFRRLYPMQWSSLLKEHRVHVHAKDSNSCPPEKEFGALTKWLAGRVKLSEFQQAFYRGRPQNNSNLLRYYASMLSEHRAHVHAGDLHLCTLEKEFGALTKWPAGLGKLFKSWQALLCRGRPQNNSNMLSYYGCKL